MRPTNQQMSCLMAVFLPFLAESAPPPEFQTRVVVSGLTRPTGIVAGNEDELFFTEIPSLPISRSARTVRCIGPAAQLA